MRHRAITLGLAAIASCALGPPLAAQEVDRLDEMRRHALERVNDARDEAGLSALRPDAGLNEAAQNHATDMVARDFYAHVGPDGRTPRDRFLATGGSRWSLSGENIAMCSGCTPPPDQERVEAFQTGWMQSPGHRENILAEGFDRFGFGISGGGDEIYAVQTFSGAGSDGDGTALDDEGTRAAALDAVNARRADRDLSPLEGSAALDTVAERIRDDMTSEGGLPDDLFGLLPEDATGWTSLSVLSGSRGGLGSSLSSEDVVVFVDNWASADGKASLGDTRAGYFGFAAATRADGRATAVAVFGGKD
ncbi:CAP domain-containing protein [uncultured Jannaschia sp.]|uniref:CAP domain-containing protein n=1 Tax=uncultured Jannaschia sp. TaxID=293347 RepID=UPI002618A468|nr:CAP domain-containing protein [uncultured Jannaschia sp.]